MATIKRFEDLEIWQLAREYAKSIRNLTLEDKFSKEFKFKDQIKDSAGSVMDNIAVGYGRASRLEFINFPGIANGSLGESKSQLYRAVDYGVLAIEAFNAHYEMAEKISAKILAFIEYLNNFTVKGAKFKGRK